MRVYGWIAAACVAFGMAAAGCGDDDGSMPPADGGMTPRDGGGGDGGGPEPCTMAGTTEDVPCGMCGTRTRFCTSGLVYEYGACTGEHGVCTAGSSMMVMCGPGGTAPATCNETCTWEFSMPCSAPLWSCAMPLEAESREGTVSVSADTSPGAPGPLDLGGMCGGAVMMPDQRPAQIVVRWVVPGTGMRTVHVSTANEGTPAEFDTLIQVRRGDCTMAPAARDGSCFDDGVPPVMPPPMVPDFRTDGRFVAMGGETLYFVVTGFGTRGMPVGGHINEGPFRLELTVGDVTPPTLTAASISVVPAAMGPGDVATVSVTGGDTGGDATGVLVTLLDAAGMPVDTNMDMMVTAADDVRADPLPPGFAGMMTFTTSFDAFALADTITRTMAPRARVRIVDAAGATSDPLTIDVVRAMRAGLGDACDAMHVCTSGLTCTMGTCAASPEVLAACMAATPLTLSGTPARATVMGTLPTGPGVVGHPAACPGSGGQVLYTVTVPSGAYDLVASTAVTGTDPMLDTVVYALSTCADPTAGPMGACVDDMLPERRATLTVQNVPAGTYTLVVSAFTALTMTAPFGLVVTLRPVLATGATCDPMGVMNRCAAGACPMSGVCP